MHIAKKIALMLRLAPVWCIISHVNPDGDTLGCASALFQAGRKMKKKVYWSGIDSFPPQFGFLPCSGEYRSGGRLPEGLLIALDVSNAERGIEGRDVDIVIDHHGTNDGFGRALNWIVPEAAATGELMYELICELGVDWDKDIASALYVAITTDCGSFSFSNTTARTLEIASHLVKHGASPSDIDFRLHFNDSIEKLHLWGICLSRAERVGEHGMISWLTREDFRITGASEADTEGLVNMLTHVTGADMTVLASEVKENIRCSVRGRGKCFADHFAAAFDGGGHKYAAGCRVYLPLEKALEKLREALKNA